MLSNSRARQLDAVAGWNGSHWLVAWYDADRPDYSIRAARVAADGSLLDPYGIDLVHGRAGTPAVVWCVDHWWVVWEESTPGSPVNGVRISPEGTVLDSSPVSIQPAASSGVARRVRLATLGSDVLAVFADGTDLVTRRIAADGSSVSSPTTIASGVSSTDLWDVEAGTDRYVVVSSLAWNIARINVAADGTAMDASPVTLVSGGGSDIRTPSIAE